jgi:monoamine oxidase
MRRRTVLQGLLASAAAATRIPPAHGKARSGSASRRTDVVVIGAGLSGLYCARLLEQQGVRVTVLEGRPDRVGGRVYTLHDLPGRPEAGGEIFGPQYGRCLDVLRELDVPQKAPNPRTQVRAGDLLLRIRDQNIRIEAWPAHPLNPHPEDLRRLTPPQLFFAHLAGLAPFKSLDDWTRPELSQWDVSFAQWMASQGFNDETIRLQQVNTAYGNTLYDVSAMHVFHFYVWSRMNATGPGRTQCVGGNDRLPKGMHDGLKGSVHLGARIVALEDRGDHVVAFAEDGKVTEATLAVCTLPATILRHLRVDPPLAGLQREAVQSLPYYATFQAHYAFRRRFWEDDGLPPSLWTDGALDRVNLLRDESGEPACLLVYVNGLQAQRLDKLSPAEADRFIRAELGRIRPSTRGQLRLLRLHSNQNDPYISGSYAFWSPGMPLRFPAALAAQHGRIHFAGEHTARIARGMEGAMESGERAALEVLARL